jgi:RNA polymerase primary sigma factor
MKSIGLDVLKSIIVVNDKENYARYFREISKYPTLTAEQEKELFIQLKAGNESVVETIIKHNLKFVVGVAKAYTSTIAKSSLTLEDLISEGNIGLILAVNGFDHELGFKFITYAVNGIRRSMIDLIQQHIKNIRTPINRQNVLRKLKRLENKLEQKLGREVDVDELCSAGKLNGLLPNSREMQYISDLKNDSVNETSLNTHVGDSEASTTLVEMLKNENAEDIVENIGKADRSKFIRTMLENTIPKDTLEYFRMYFGLDGNDPMTYDQISKVTGIKPHTVNNKVNAGLSHLYRKHRRNYELIRDM